MRPTDVLRPHWERLARIAQKLPPLYQEREGVRPLSWETVPILLALACDLKNPQTVGLLRQLADVAERSLEGSVRAGLLHYLELAKHRWFSVPRAFPPQALEAYRNPHALPVWRCHVCDTNWAGAWRACPVCNSVMIRDAIEALLLKHRRQDFGNPGIPFPGMPESTCASRAGLPRSF